MRSLRQKKWALTPAEAKDLESAITAMFPSGFLDAPGRPTALRRPEEDDARLEIRRQIALDIWVTQIDKNLEFALRNFLPDELWSLLHAIELAEAGLPSRRLDALRSGVREYRAHADEFVAAWRRLRRVRVHLTDMAKRRGLRGWDDPTEPRYSGSAPLETANRDALMTAESALLQYTAGRVAQWLTSRAHVRGIDSRDRRVRLRREAVALMSNANMGYRRIVSLATSPAWRRPPCASLDRSRLEDLVKADLRRDRRGSATWGAAIEP